MSRVRVKICGITRNEDLTVAIEAGADAVGFVVGVPSSPRNLTLNKAEEILRNTPIFVNAVAVTVPKNLDQLMNIHEKLRPDALQIHGGYGYTTEFEFERELRDSVGSTLFAGTSEIQRNIIAQQLGL